MQVTTSTTTQSIGRRVYINSVISERIREKEFVEEHLTLLRHSWWAIACGLVDQHEALAVTTGLTDTVYLFAYQNSNRQPLGQ